MNRERTEGGFTLVELMVSLVVFSFVIAGVLAVAVSMTQGFREQRQTIATESAARLPLDLIADSIRQASPGVPDPRQLQDGITCMSGAITVWNGSGANSSDKLDLIYASGAVVTSSQTDYVSGSTSLQVTDASQLTANDYIVISNQTQGTLLQISSISGTTLTLNTQCSTISLPSGGYTKGAIVVRAQHATFYVGTQDGIPTLFMDPDSTGTAAAEPLAENIEDLQVALGIDSAADGVSENGTTAGDDEWIYNVAGETLPGTGTYRAVRVSVLARSPQSLIGAATPFLRPKLEDHAVATTNDAYKRRALRTIVEIRNTSVSP